MAFFSKSKGEKGTDLAEPGSTAVTAAQNDNSREDCGLFVITTPRENDHSVELGETPNYHP